MSHTKCWNISRALKVNQVTSSSSGTCCSPHYWWCRSFPQIIASYEDKVQWYTHAYPPLVLLTWMCAWVSQVLFQMCHMTGSQEPVSSIHILQTSTCQYHRLVSDEQLIRKHYWLCREGWIAYWTSSLPPPPIFCTRITYTCMATWVTGSYSISPSKHAQCTLGARHLLLGLFQLLK